MSQTPEPLTVRVEADEAGVTVDVHGELDLSTANQLLEQATAGADWSMPRTMSVDLAGVGFCDSAGISVLVVLRRRCDEWGWRFQVVGTPEPVRRMLVDYTGLGEYLNVT